MMEITVFGILSIYLVYWVIKSLIDRLYFEALMGTAIGVLSAQIFVVANYDGQFLRMRMAKNLNIALQSIGLLLLAGSLALLIGAFFSKRKMSSLVSLWGSTQLFMTQGVYGIIRHPVHLSGILATLGIALLMANIAVVALAVIACVAFFVASREEDRHSKEKIGHEYDVYMQNVPAFNFVQGISKALQNRSVG